MNDVMQIIRINGYIQRELGKLYLYGKEVLCVALDGTCTFVEGGADVELTAIQIEDLLNQTFGQAPATRAPTPEYKVLGARWFTPRMDTIGIVAVETFNDTWKAFLGTAAGHDQTFDEQFVASWGASLSPEEAHGFFPHLDIKAYKTEQEHTS